MRQWFGRAGAPKALGELSMRQLRTRAATILVLNDGRRGLDDVKEILRHIEDRYDDRPVQERRMKVIDGGGPG